MSRWAHPKPERLESSGVSTLGGWLPPRPLCQWHADPRLLLPQVSHQMPPSCSCVEPPRGVGLARHQSGSAGNRESFLRCQEREIRYSPTAVLGIPTTASATAPRRGDASNLEAGLQLAEASERRRRRQELSHNLTRRAKRGEASGIGTRTRPGPENAGRLAKSLLSAVCGVQSR